MSNFLEVFRPNRSDPKECLVMNADGGVISPVMGREEAESFAAKVVNGRVPHLVGTIECFVVKIVPLSRVRDKSIANTDVERLDA